MTIVPHRYDITIVQGADFYLPFAIEAPNGTTYDLAEEGDGYTVGQAVVRDTYDGTVMLTFATAGNPNYPAPDGEMVLTAFTDASGSWSGYLFASAAVTAALDQWGEGVHDVEIATSTGTAAHVERPFYGTAVLSPEVTS